MSRKSGRRSTLRVSFSNLMLRRSNDWLDDPQYATLPQRHLEEIRPSILERYRFTESIPKSDERYARVLSTPTITTTTTETSDGKKLEPRLSTISRVFKPKITRTLDWSIEPFLHYCSSKLQLGSAAKSGSTDISDPQRAAFELLPPLFESSTHALLYQNSYLLDGVKYEFDPKKTRNDQKLRTNYLKFFKSVNKKRKPSDCEVVFGDATIIYKPPPHWETSRIDWLYNLEKKQEKRKQDSCLEDQFVTTTAGSFLDFYRSQKQKRNRMKKMCKKCKKEWQGKNIEDNASVLSIDGSNMCTRFPSGNQNKKKKKLKGMKQ